METLAIFDDVACIVDKLKSFAPEVVFNLTESFYCNRAHEPNIPALLELMRVKYTGRGPTVSMLCKDKALAKKVLAYHRVRVPHFVISTELRPLKRLRRFVYPAFVKPVGEESSDGIAKASFAKSEEEALERARFIQEKFHCDALIEEYIEGRELYLSVMGNRKLTVFPPREIFFNDVPEDIPSSPPSKPSGTTRTARSGAFRMGRRMNFPRVSTKNSLALPRKVYRVLKIRASAEWTCVSTQAGEVVVIEANPNPSLACEDDFAQAAARRGVAV